MVEGARFHYVGSLRPSLNRDLLTLPLEQFRPCYGEGETATHTYREKRRAHGREVTLVMTFNRQLETHLRATLEDILVMAEERLRGWAAALAEDQTKGRSRGRRTLATCRNRVRKLLGHAEPLFRWSVTRTGRGPFEVHWSRDEAAIRRRSEGFGRTLIYTDQHGWSD